MVLRENLSLIEGQPGREAEAGRSLWQDAWRRLKANRLAVGSAVFLLLMALACIVGPFVTGALNRDYTLVMGTVVLIAIFIIVFNLIVDVLYAVLDPRVRYD